MSRRSGELLLKAIRGLPAEEQDELLVALLSGETPIGVPPARRVDPRTAAAPGTAPPAPEAGPSAGPRSILWPAVAGTAVTGPVVLGGPPPGPAPFEIPVPPPGIRSFEMFAQAPGREDPELRVLPVRLPAADYQRLRRWSREHDFSMAVIIRTLVERFLDEQDAEPSDRPKRRARKPKRRADPDAAPA